MSKINELEVTEVEADEDGGTDVHIDPGCSAIVFYPDGNHYVLLPAVKDGDEDLPVSTGMKLTIYAVSMIRLLAIAVKESGGNESLLDERLQEIQTTISPLDKMDIN